MRDFVEFLVKSIASNQEQVQVTETKEMDITKISVKVAQEDMGALIGKEGRIIKSIRSLVRAKAIKDGIRANIELADDNVNN